MLLQYLTLKLVLVLLLSTHLEVAGGGRKWRKSRAGALAYAEAGPAPRGPAGLEASGGPARPPAGQPSRPARHSCGPMAHDALPDIEPLRGQIVQRSLRVGVWFKFNGRPWAGGSPASPASLRPAPCGFAASAFSGPGQPSPGPVRLIDPGGRRGLGLERGARRRRRRARRPIAR